MENTVTIKKVSLVVMNLQIIIIQSCSPTQPPTLQYWLPLTTVTVSKHSRNLFGLTRVVLTLWFDVVNTVGSFLQVRGC